jgi:hypothetical protein
MFSVFKNLDYEADEAFDSHRTLLTEFGDSGIALRRYWERVL